MQWNVVKWNEMKWSEMLWNEMTWNEMKWSEMKWNALKWNYMKLNWSDTKLSEKKNKMKLNEIASNDMTMDNMKRRKCANISYQSRREASPPIDNIAAFSNWSSRGAHNTWNISEQEQQLDQHTGPERCSSYIWLIHMPTNMLCIIAISKRLTPLLSTLQTHGDIALSLD